MPEIQGTVQEADEKSFKIDGTWYKYSKQAKPPPRHVAVGETVKVTFTVSDYEGRSYNWCSKTEAVRVASGGVAPQRDEGIAWMNALNGAVTALVANQQFLGERGVPITAHTVLDFARDLFAARPWAEPEEPEPVYEPAEPAP